MNESVQEVKLDKMKMVAITMIEEELGKHFAIPARCATSTNQAFAHQTVVLRVVQEILGHIVECQEVRHPANWWEAVKQRFMPEWIKRRWPVKETVVTLTARELYPSIAMPDQHCIIDISKSIRAEKVK